jgi:hypothetical protein
MVGDGDTAHAPGFPPFTHGGIVDLAAEQQGPMKHPLLFGGWLEFVLVGFADALLFPI